MKRVKKSQDYKERLERAFLFVLQDKIAVLKAARLCGVPWRTLRKRLTGEDSLENPGRQQILTKKEEEQIVNHITHLANCGYPPTPTRRDVLEIASETVIFLKRRPANFILSTKWFSGFMSRWPQLRLAKPQ
ncbi:hypothetical protein HOLleu_12200 [Holothuria leucospilota]|uniref:HTH CENPB-type domain-containing protein n=1 Tax=Holothuria leucospilota TaxID=206669 RepID=A0A9Q1CAI0_HOLLE|nr:hypothetical protein HOLleu_12200 [Holothuria leucospilota]